MSETRTPGTRDAGRPQSLKITAREALREARARRGEGKPALAAAALDRAAQARRVLLINYNDSRLERELRDSLDTFDGDPPDFAPKGETREAARRRRALMAHLYNAEKAAPR